GLDLIPSSTRMSGIEYELFSKRQRELILKKGIAGIRKQGDYDYILIDAPPTLGGWVTNILHASDDLIIPVEASPWGLFGLANMFEYLSEVQKTAVDLKLMGIAVTKVDTRKNYFKQTLETLEALDEVKVFQNYIRVDSAIEWAQDNCKPVLAYKKSSRSAKEYMALAQEIRNQ
ncbi:MAG: ParA family protein, partial [Lachnospiraceae bacterium]